MLPHHQHKQSTYCKKGKTCRFHFPRPPSPETYLIANPELTLDTLVEAQSILTKVRDKITFNTIDVDLNDLLVNSGVEYDKYLQAKVTY